MRRVSERCEAAQRARLLLQAAYDACYKAPDRDILGMSTGPFSGVNEVLGLIAEMDEQIAYADAITARAIEAAANAATERAAVTAEQFSQSAHIAYSMRSGDFPKIARIEDAIAAAIRKGGVND